MGNIEEETIILMVSCFLQCDKPELVEYLAYLVDTLEKQDESDSDSDSDFDDEDLEIQIDEKGFHSLK